MISGDNVKKAADALFSRIQFAPERRKHGIYGRRKLVYTTFRCPVARNAPEWRIV